MAKHEKTILLLGAGHPDENLEKRRRVRDKLQSEPYGYRAIIMEDYPDSGKVLVETYTEKFFRILKERQPQMVFAIFPKRGKYTAIEWELGALSCRSKSYKNFRKKVVLMLNDISKMKRLSAFSKQYVSKGASTFCNWRTLPEEIHLQYEIRRKNLPH